MTFDFQPSIRLTDILGQRFEYNRFTNKERQFFLTKNGRSALVRGLSIIYNPQKSKILVPDYNCGNEIEAVVKSGHTPVFYPINKGCKVNPATILNRIDKTVNAILVTHYNGYPQPIFDIVDLCRKEKIYLVEDCAHVLNTDLNDQPLGSFGELSIFSPRKQLPIPDGGILYLNSDHLSARLNLNRLRKTQQLLAIFDLVKPKIKQIFPGKSMGGVLFNEIKYTTISENINLTDFTEVDYDAPMSAISKFLLPRFNLNQIAKIRRRNFNLLHDRFKNIECIEELFPPPEKTVCPWLYLAIVPNPWDLFAHLRAARIPCIVFWSFFHRLYPFGQTAVAENLKKHVIGLPIHQQISENELDVMAENIRNYFKIKK
ncbi:MAG: hypothetical protein HF981_02405 [Desulfobacteraceae bacterium]|nr:hypothetical protein [Desulfobacteraceae bacterium]MBC2749215.1 DegT/DnrJ/EryC1/StrS family aminotransferase [Desulfobacteraceae bacterium]